MNNISVTSPVGMALRHVGKVLFKPFDIGKWFIIGFCAWLAYLCEGGGFHGGGNFGSGHGPHGQSARAQVERAMDYVASNIAWIAPLAIAVFLVLVAVGLVMLWVSSRGRFMFLHCLALNTAEVQVPWQKFSAEANSLFLFRLVLSLVSSLVFLPLLGGLALVVIRMVLRDRVSVAGMMASAGLVLAMVLAGAVFWIIGRLTKDFVVPIQFLRRNHCLEAWRDFRGLLAGHVGDFILYFLFRIVLAIAMSIAVMIVIFATCCIAGCLFLIPYIGTVLLLPVLAFERSYSLFYLAQYGPDYDVFLPPAGNADRAA